MRATDTFRDAEALAEFANLDQADANAVEYFRNNYPDFAPTEWWDFLCRIDGLRVIRIEDIDKIKNNKDYEAKLKNLGKGLQQWEYTQGHIQQVWKAKFKLNVSAISDLLKLVFDVDRPGVLWNSSQVLAPNGTIYELNTRLYGFHKALLYLHQHPKQAKICKSCRKYFVTAAGKRIMCMFPDKRGETCSQKQIREQHLEWWNTVRAKQRKAKQKQKAKQKRTR